MIKIVCDQYELRLSSDQDYQVLEKSDYEEALERMIHAEESEPDYAIVVRNPALFDWFDSPAKQCGMPIVVLDPCKILAKALNISDLPEIFKINPKWIVELNLLELASNDPIRPGEKAEFWLNRCLLGNGWDEEHLSFENLSKVIIFFLNHKEDNLHEFYLGLIKRQLNYWRKNSDEMKDLIGWLSIDPFSRSKYLAWEFCLRFFPSERVSEWLQQNDIWYTLSLLPNRQRFIDCMDVSIQLPENIAKFLRSFLHETWDVSPSTAVSFISGKFVYENKFLIEKIEGCLKNGILLEQDVLSKLSDLPFSDVLELVNQLTPVREPMPLDKDAKVEQVQEWIRDQYLPYYNHCSIFQRLELTEPFVNQYEIWLKKQYEGLIINGKGMAYRQLPALKTDLMNGPFLMIVFDGLDYFSAQEDLAPHLKERGLFPTQLLKPFLSFLPSETPIAKPSLVAGRLHSQLAPDDQAVSSYQELLRDALKLPKTEIRSATDKDASLTELLQEPAKAYLYMDNQLDREYLHVVMSPYLRRKKYRQYLQKQAVAIAESVGLFKEMYDQDLTVCICSDHGATIIPKTALVIPIPENCSAKSRSLYAEKCKTGIDFEDLHVWRLNPDCFGIENEMIIPLGYNCFGKRPLGATHGGCSPQEMAVPWFILGSEVPKELFPLDFLIKGDIYRKRRDNQLTICISNPNDHDVSITSCTVGEHDLSAYLSVSIHKNGFQEIIFNFNAEAIKDGYVNFEVKYHMRTYFSEADASCSLKVETTGAMSVEFDNEFEF
ncbi:MAG: hypothetical protein JEZ06_21920 [Anaerolineaceae bacterium]|nr:hypothetical protein [Anaerolineaceae bacterium]